MTIRRHDHEVNGMPVGLCHLPTHVFEPPLSSAPVSHSPSVDWAPGGYVYPSTSPPSQKESPDVV